MIKRLELHNHTSESDANLSLEDLVNHMESDRADAFALTDHNTISGHRKMRDLLASGRFHTECIYGMEYTTYYGHILCFNLNEYVPWDSIDKHKPELLFQAVRQKGGIAGIAHPFSFGYPFAQGCRFEMTVHDFSSIDFIEIFNNPEPLHEVNEKGLLWWESLVLEGHRLAATCGMDLHGKWDMGGQYASFIEGEPGGDIAGELANAIHSQKVWVSKGLLLLSSLSADRKALEFSLLPTQKPGFEPAKNGSYCLSLRTAGQTWIGEIRPDTVKTVPLSQLTVSGQASASCDGAGTIIIPKLYVENTDIEHLICLSPVITI